MSIEATDKLLQDEKSLADFDGKSSELRQGKDELQHYLTSCSEYNRNAIWETFYYVPLFS